MGCNTLTEMTKELALLSPASWIVVSWSLNEVYKPLHMINGNVAETARERISHPSPDDPHNRTMLMRSVDEMVAVLRVRTQRAKIIIGARHSLYDLHPSYDNHCALAIARFLSHGIHAESGDPTFADLKHVGNHVLESHDNHETLSERFMDHIADVRHVPGI